MKLITAHNIISDMVVCYHLPSPMSLQIDAGIYYLNKQKVENAQESLG